MRAFRKEAPVKNPVTLRQANRSRAAGLQAVHRRWKLPAQVAVRRAVLPQGLLKEAIPRAVLRLWKLLGPVAVPQPVRLRPAAVAARCSTWAPQVARERQARSVPESVAETYWARTPPGTEANPNRASQAVPGCPAVDFQVVDFQVVVDLKIRKIQLAHRRSRPSN